MSLFKKEIKKEKKSETSKLTVFILKGYLDGCTVLGAFGGETTVPRPQRSTHHGHPHGYHHATVPAEGTFTSL
jgi:hypothetical protein